MKRIAFFAIISFLCLPFYSCRTSDDTLKKTASNTSADSDLAKNENLKEDKNSDLSADKSSPKMNPDGTLTYPDGSSYSGETKNGKPNGNGILKYDI